MEALLTTLGTLLVMFMILATAVEAILEAFRGLLERLGVSWAKSRVSLEDALLLASEFSDPQSALQTKLQAVKATAEQFADTSKDRLDKLEAIRTDLKNLTKPADSDALAARLTEVANQVKAEFDANDRVKVYILRFAAAVLGCILVLSSEFYVFEILTFGIKKGGFGTAINVLVGGIAAAAGSSYWHDQIDRLRSLKSAVTGAKSLIAG